MVPKLTSLYKESKELTLDQLNALKAFNLWLSTPSENKPFVLSGFAGSGKTFLSIEFLKRVELNKLCWTVAAPTHKAVGVLRRYLDLAHLRSTWYPSTIHRLLRLKIKRKGDLEICEQTKETTNCLEGLHLILIDEASMINSNLLDITLKCAFPFKTKLVFVGDTAQLPPIGEPISPVFSLQRAVNFKLRNVVRHQGPVLKLASCIREEKLPCEQPPCMPDIKTNESVVGFLKGDIWLEKAKSSLCNASQTDDPDSARILCYTNRTLENLVPHVRRAIHGDMADHYPVLPGEVLITRNAIMANSSVNPSDNEEEPDMLFGSNRELIVTDVKSENFDLSDLSPSYKEIFETSLIETLIVKVSSGRSEHNLRLLPSAGSNSRKVIDQTLNNLRMMSKNVEKDQLRNIWKSFFLIRDSFASLGPASVLTVHRSQGSTFGEVFIASDIFTPKNLALRRQLTYVAVSRARKAVWIAGKQSNNSNKLFWKTQICRIND